jgi:LPXTG-motif cell wall-anchored protein
VNTRFKQALGGIAGLGFLVALGLGPSPASAQATPASTCATCDKLNAKPGQGGPGFFGWHFECTDDGGTVTASVTTKGQPGEWIATMNSTVVKVVGKATLSTAGIYHGATVTFSLMRPDGTYAIAPRSQVFECGDCDQPTTTIASTVPDTTVPSSTVPGATSSVMPSAPGTVPPGHLPDTGASTIDQWIIGLGLLSVGAAGVGIARARKSREA